MRWLAVAFLLCGCRAPTQIYVDVYTEVACDKASDVTVTVGQLGPIERKPPSSSVRRCDPVTTRVGTLVLHPSQGTDDAVAFKVVTHADGAPAESCGAPEYEDCIVARRSLRFVSNTSLRVRVDLRAECKNKACDEGATCVRGECVSARIADPMACASATGCDEDTLRPRGPDVPDAGADVDAAVADAGDAEASTPATVLGCTEEHGVDPLAEWPIEGYCRTHRARSRFAGPKDKPTIKWSPVIGNQILATPLIDRHGNIYAGSDTGRFVSFDKQGGVRWEKQIDSIVGTPVITRDGVIHVGTKSGKLHAYEADGTERPVRNAGTGESQLVADAEGTTLYFTTMTDLVALGPSGELWRKKFSQSLVFATPLVRTSGDVVVPTGLEKLASVSKDGATVSYSDDLRAFGFESLVMEDARGRIITFSFSSRRVTALEPNLKYSWTALLPASVMGIAGDDEGNTFVCTDGEGLWRLDDKGAATKIVATGRCGAPLIDNRGIIYVATSGGLLAIDKNGGVQWQVDGTPSTWSSPSLGSDGTIYFGGRSNGRVYAVGPP